MGDTFIETIRGLRNDDLVKLYKDKFSPSTNGQSRLQGIARAQSEEEVYGDRRLYAILSTEIFLRAFHLYADSISFELLANSRQSELLSNQDSVKLQEWKSNPPKYFGKLTNSIVGPVGSIEASKLVTLLWTVLEELVQNKVILRKDKRSLYKHLLGNFDITYDTLPVFVLCVYHTPAIIQYLKLSSSQHDYIELLNTTQLAMTHESLKHLPLKYLGLLVQPFTKPYLDILVTKLAPNYMITYKKTTN